MKFKVGDKVVLKGYNWDNGRYREITGVELGCYRISESPFAWEEYELELYKEDKEMKFKVGNGVRLAEENEYKAISVNDGGLVVKDNHDGKYYKISSDGMKEIKKDNGIYKTFAEVIKDIKIGEVWILRDFKIEKSEAGIFITFGEQLGIFGIYFEDDEKFTLQRKGISFNDAFVKFWEGVKIESYNGNTFEYNPITTQVTLGNNKSNLTKVVTLLDNIFSPIELENQWYIAD